MVIVLAIPLFLLLLSFFVSFALVVCANIYGLKLKYYLARKNSSRWREITTIGRFGPGLSNPARMLEYTYSDLDNEDETILRYKKKIKKTLKYLLFSVAAMFIGSAGLGICVFLLGVLGGKP